MPLMPVGAGCATVFAPFSLNLFFAVLKFLGERSGDVAIVIVLRFWNGCI